MPWADQGCLLFLLACIGLLTPLACACSLATLPLKALAVSLLLCLIALCFRAGGVHAGKG